MKARNILPLLFACSLILPTACDVKDPIFDTAHPGHGTVTLTTDWSGIGSGLTAPGAYTVTATPNGSATPGYIVTLTSTTNRLDHLFAPGAYRFLVHNTTEQITVSGTTATVSPAPVTPADAIIGDAIAMKAIATTSAPNPADASVPMISNAPGWLFSCTNNLAVTQDAEHTLTAAMQQQVRELTLILKPEGDAKDRIERIEAYLTGAASTLDLATGIHGAPQAVTLPFTKITTGAHAGSWTATVRLLGTAGPEQRLKASIRFAGGNPSPHTVNSDLTTALATFNTDKRTPLTLDASVDTPSEAGFGATITDWETVTGNGPVVAE